MRKDGTAIEVAVASHAIDFRGRTACVVIAEDVTEKERLRVQLQQSQRLESLGQLAGGVAHDFNNLLAVILGYAAFIERRAQEGSRDERDVTEIRKAGERAVRLTQQLLSFARREVVRPRVLDLTGVVLEMEELLRRTLGEHVVLRTSLAADLWPIMADYGQLEQVLVNLAVNARDAMPDGGTLTLDTENIAVDERLREHADRASSAGPLRAPAGQRHRRRDVARGRRARVRAVLHHQAQGPGHRARPGDDPRHRDPGRRARADLLRAGAGHDVHGPAADDRRARAGHARRGARASPSAAAARRSSSSRTSRRCSR